MNSKHRKTNYSNSRFNIRRSRFVIKLNGFNYKRCEFNSVSCWDINVISKLQSRHCNFNTTIKELNMLRRENIMKTSELNSMKRELNSTMSEFDSETAAFSVTPAEIAVATIALHMLFLNMFSCYPVKLIRSWSFRNYISSISYPFIKNITHFN